jgi:hypothetical protein
MQFCSEMGRIRTLAESLKLIPITSFGDFVVDIETVDGRRKTGISLRSPDSSLRSVVGRETGEKLATCSEWSFLRLEEKFTQYRKHHPKIT